MEKEGIVKHSKRIKIGAAVGALVLAIATPVALAQAGDDDPGDLDTGAEGLICFEVGEYIGGPFGFDGEWPFEGDFPFEGMPGEEFWFEGEWPLEFHEGEFPPGFGFEGELLPAMDEMLDLVNEESMALAEHLENAGIDHEVVTGPMGVVWVEWDFSDPAANEAVEEFIIENGGLIDMAAGILPLHGPLHDFGEIPFGPEGLLFGSGEIPFGFEGLPFGMDEIPFGADGLPFDLQDLEGFFGADGLPFDLQDLEGFFGADPWDLGEGFLGLSGEMAWGGAFSGEMMFGGPFGPGMVCVETIGSQADRIGDEAAGLAEALAAAGIDVTIETRQIAVPIWDTDDEAAREVVEQYYADLLGLSRVVSGDGS